MLMIGTCEFTPMLVGRIDPSITCSPGSSYASPLGSTTPRRGSFATRALPSGWNAMHSMRRGSSLARSSARA